MFLLTIKLFISMLIPSGVGYALLAVLCGRMSLGVMLRSALGFGIGFGILSHWMLVLGILNIPWDVAVIGLPLIFLLFFLSWKIHQTRHALFPSQINSTKGHRAPPLPQPYGTLDFIAISYITFIFLFVFWQSLTIPIHSWDALATYAFKAKVFFFDRTIHRLHVPHPSFPPHLSFIYTWINLNLGVWNDVLVNIVFPLTLAAYSVVHYSYLKILTNRRWALGGLCLLLSSNFLVYHATIAYNDLSMMYYNCTSIILLLWWNRQGNDSWLILASIFSGLTTFIKLEGTEYLLIHTILCLVILNKNTTYNFQKKFFKFLKFVVPSYGICLFFNLYKLSAGVLEMEGRIRFILSFQSLSRLPDILKAFGQSLFMMGNWHLLWSILIISLVSWHIGKYIVWPSPRNPGFPGCCEAVTELSYVKRARRDEDIKLLLDALVLFIGLYIIFFTFTSASVDYPTTVSRVVLHFFPLCPLLIILLNHAIRHFYLAGRPSQ
jgi:hypothetical protein